MEERNITVTLDKAREWFNSENATLREIALQAFDKDELTYNVLSGDATDGVNAGLGNFNPNIGVGFAANNLGFLGCASKEIAQHLGKYFGMLITEAKYGDMVDFEIISDY